MLYCYTKSTQNIKYNIVIILIVFIEDELIVFIEDDKPDICLSI